MSIARWWVFETGKRGQQAGVDVDEAPLVMPHEARREDAHEAGQQHQPWPVGVDGGHQRGIESLTVGMQGVVHGHRVQTAFTRPGQTGGTGLVAHHGGHAHTESLRPAALHARLHQRRHVGAAARDQNDDVLLCCARHGRGV